MNFRTIKLSQTNCYLLTCKDGFLLIDCGNVSDKLTFLYNLNKIGVDPSQIRCLFLTHHHNDHCGLLSYLVSVNPGIKVIMTRKCADYLQTGTHFIQCSERYSNPLLNLFINTYSRFIKKLSINFEPYFVREKDFIIEEDNNNLLGQLGIEGSIILTPGHTEDSMSIVTSSSAFIGDAARNMLNFTGTPYQPIILYALEECHNSWHKLIDSGVKEIYPAHGKPFGSEKLRNLLK